MKIPLILSSLSALLVLSAAAETTQVTSLNLTPLPKSITMDAGSLILTEQTSVSLDAASGVVGKHFVERLRRGTGWKLPIVESGTLRLEVVPNPQVSKEAYRLQVTQKGVSLQAASSAGIARGSETLMQLLPPAVYGSGQFKTLTLPTLTISDAPEFAWRGSMLDVSRKLQNKDTVLKLLDGLAASKINIFHWHLTDDQGWRLPIEGYPKLTEKGPAYSREDIREVVEHAAKLAITILPETDMPGHSGASCRAYPEIGTPNKEGKMTGTMNPGADATYKFIEAVMKELAAQFPNSPQFHIGADEVGGGDWKFNPQCIELMKRENLKNSHELGIHFLNRVVAIAKRHGKTCIAWNEALDPKLDPAVTIMSWQGMEPGVKAVKAGRTVIFCPTPQIYYDHPNSRSKLNPPGYSAHTGYLNQSYYFNPALPALTPEERLRVIGGQGCLWSERVGNADHMLLMMFPRISALGENLWTSREQLDWPDFLRRLNVHQQRLDAMKINYFRDPESLAVNVGSWKPGEVAEKKGVLEFPLDGKLRHPGVQEFFVAQGTGDGRFQIDAVELLKDGVVIDQDRHDYELSYFKRVASLYLVRNTDLDGKYSVRLRVTVLSGDGSAIVQLIPALAPDNYSKQCAPDTGANRTNNKPVQ
jgi:hexosaminidase